MRDKVDHYIENLIALFNCNLSIEAKATLCEDIRPEALSLMVMEWKTMQHQMRKFISKEEAIIICFKEDLQNLKNDKKSSTSEYFLSHYGMWKQCKKDVINDKKTKLDELQVALKHNYQSVLVVIDLIIDRFNKLVNLGEWKEDDFSLDDRTQVMKDIKARIEKRLTRLENQLNTRTQALSK